jgi:hypothetical protein
VQFGCEPMKYSGQYRHCFGSFRPTRANSSKFAVRETCYYSYFAEFFHIPVDRNARF